MNTLDDLLAANETMGDNDNIFGAGNSAIDAGMKMQQSGTNIVDYKKYASVPDTEKVDYAKLTQISDKDVFNIVSVQETVIKYDGSGGNVTKQTINYKVDGDNTNTSQLQVNKYVEQRDEYVVVESDNETERIDKLRIIIENDETLNLTISGNTNIATIKSLSTNYFNAHL